MKNNIYKLVAALSAFILVSVFVVITINNFLATNKFIIDSEIKIQLINATLPYTYVAEGWYYEQLPENYSYTENDIYVSIVESNGRDFIAVGYHKNDVYNQFCYDSRTLEVEPCSLAPIA